MAQRHALKPYYTAATDPHWRQLHAAKVELAGCRDPERRIELRAQIGQCTQQIHRLRTVARSC